MKKLDEKQQEKIYILKVILKDIYKRVEGTPYRVIAVPGTFTLYELAEEIVKSFDFYFDHCFGFYDNLNSWTNSNKCYELFKDIEEELELEPTCCKSVKKTRIDKVFNKIGRKMLFLFDYGD